MFLDGHIHLWRLDDGEHIWIREKIGGLARDFTEDDFRAVREPVHVGGAVLVQAAHSVGEAERWLAVAQTSDQLAGVVGWADLHGPGLVETVERLRTFRKFVGLRPLPPDTFGADWLAAPKTVEALQSLARIGCPVDTLVRVGHLDAARKIFARIDTLKLCLDHGGRPPVLTEELEPWRTRLAAFARDTNAVVKCSGLMERSGVESTVETLRPYVETIVELFGPDRVMFATNWPVLEIGGTYGGWVRMLTAILDRMGLSAEDKDQIMWRTCATFYGIRWPAAAASAQAGPDPEDNKNECAARTGRKT